ncbi:chaperone protein DNAJ-like protein [Leishmania donovani]|uniref:Chaperone protein DNAJ-like protein n=1 Tax=Leishmania donovani TaxID=5661 RepID=A0A3Q8IET3_LEIDO|nr:chaperone protein DNAJ-like protein [Leishmania donovani]
MLAPRSVRWCGGNRRSSGSASVGVGPHVRTTGPWMPWHTLLYQRRCFQVIQRGHDRPQESLYNKLGFAKDTEARLVRRSTTELRQALLRRVEELKDPANDPADKKRLSELKDAYTRLQDDCFRTNYASHYYASNDARLHVLCDGGQVAANFNPEHQQFTYVDHAIDRESTGSGVGRCLPAGKAGGSALSSGPPGRSEVPTAEALGDAFRNATGVGESASGATSSNATAYKAADAAGALNGTDITHLLRVTLEQSLAGCEVEVAIHKNVRCVTCRGSGRQQLRTPRKCPQCLGRGSAHMPSATYHIERRCLYCGGEGTVPAPPCRACDGRGVQLHQAVQVPVSVPAGTLSNSLFRLRHQGHDGVRGGHAGDLLLTVLVSEHRYFYRSPERSHELHAMLPLPLSVALLGGRVNVPTLNGFGTVHVPPCVRSGEVLPLDVYGAPDATNRASAAAAAPHTILYHALVMIPKGDALSGRQKAALQLYEAHHSYPSATAAEVEAVGRSRTFGAEASQQQAPASSAGTVSREQLMASCAALKSSYTHWFHAD